MSNEQLNTNPQKNNRNKKMFSFNFYWMYGIIFLILMALLMTNGSSGVKEIGWSEFQSLTEQDAFSKILVFNKKNILEASVNKDKTALVFKEENEKNLKDPKVFVKIPSADKFSDFYDKCVEQNLTDAQVSYEESDDTLWSFIFSYGPIILFIAVWIFLMKRMSGNAGGGNPGNVFNVGKAKARLFDKDNDKRITFKDVAGLAEAKEEVEEIVSFRDVQTALPFGTAGGKHN